VTAKETSQGALLTQKKY